MDFSRVVNSDDFNPAASGHVALVFSALGCRACEQLESAISGTVAIDCLFFVHKVGNEFSYDGLLGAYRIRSFPTTVLFERGNEKIRWEGFFSDDDPGVRLSLFQDTFRRAITSCE